ncbi:MAG TPA: SHOCT domain-containing protein [Dehalococcoidia bacterium]|nr:SHOCT domain-containing protein [Dehalococcoidia bacterium]
MWHDGSGWWMLWGAVMMVLFWGGLIALFVWGLQSLVRRDATRDPLEIAKERLARGEITPGQFDEIKEKLRT